MVISRWADRIRDQHMLYPVWFTELLARNLHATGTQLAKKKKNKKQKTISYKIRKLENNAGHNFFSRSSMPLALMADAQQMTQMDNKAASYFYVDSRRKIESIFPF